MLQTHAGSRHEVRGLSIAAAGSFPPNAATRLNVEQALASTKSHTLTTSYNIFGNATN